MGIETAIASAALSTAVGGAIAAKGTALAGTFLFGTAFGSFLARTAIGLVLNALAPKPKTQGANRGYQVTTRGSALDQQIIYGRMRVGGVIVYDGATGVNNRYLHRVVAFAGHEVESFDEVYLDDEVVEIGGVDHVISYTRKIRQGRPENGNFVEETVELKLFNVPTADAVYAAGDSLDEQGFNDLFNAAASKTIDGGEVFTLSAPFQRFVSATLDSKAQSPSKEVAGSKYNGKVRINTHLGSEDQMADEDLVNEIDEWTPDHRLRGIAYLYVRLAFDPDVFPNGEPDITATIKGKKVFDPRTLTTEWSDNPALCIRDYIEGDYGLGESRDNIDGSLVRAAADACEETNTLDGSKRYTCNGAFVTDVAPVDILNDLLTSMGGLLWYAQGKWRMKAAKYVAPTVTLTEDDLRSSISVKTRHSRRDNFNRIKGTFRGEESNWQVTDYPEVNNQAFIDADNGQESVLDLELPFTDNSSEARRIARVSLERNRQQLTVSASFGLKAFRVQTGDIIRLSVDRFGWDSKEFEVTSWIFGLVDEYDLQVQMTLREISESVFDEIDDGVVYERDNTTLESAFSVPPVGISTEASTRVIREKLTNVINATISTSRPEAVDRVEVEYKESGEDVYTSVGTGELGVFRLVDLDTGFYDIRARAINTFGVKGVWTYAYLINANGLLQPPSDIEQFTAEVNGATTQLEWEPVTDLDLSYYIIRHSAELPGSTPSASWSNATTAVDKVPRPASSVSVPSRPGTYHIKAVDKSGISSSGYESVVVPPAALENFDSTLTQTEDPDFLGSKSNTSVVSSSLVIQDRSGDNNSGTYDFTDYIELNTGGVPLTTRARIRIEVNVQRGSPGTGGISVLTDTFDDLRGPFDNLPGLFDNLTQGDGYSDINVKFFVSSTEDDPSGSPTWGDYQQFKTGDFYGRAFRFRVELTSQSQDVTPVVTGLKAIAEFNT